MLLQSTDLSSPTLGSLLKRAPSKSGAGSARRQLASVVLCVAIFTLPAELAFWWPTKCLSCPFLTIFHEKHASYAICIRHRYKVVATVKKQLPESMWAPFKVR